MLMKKLKHKLVSRRETLGKIKFTSKDKVIVITGKDKGVISNIIEIKKGNEFVKLDNVRMQTHYTKADGVNTGGMVSKEGWIHISNISHIGEDGKPTKVRIVKTSTGHKQLINKKTGKELIREKVETSPKIVVEDQVSRKEKEELKKIKFDEEQNKDKEAGLIKTKEDNKKDKKGKK